MKIAWWAGGTKDCVGTIRYCPAGIYEELTGEGSSSLDRRLGVWATISSEHRMRYLGTPTKAWEQRPQFEGLANPSGRTGSARHPGCGPPIKSNVLPDVVTVQTAGDGGKPSDIISAGINV
jgi:hypothetical protein